MLAIHRIAPTRLDLRFILENRHAQGATQPNQIVVSRAYCEVISRITDNAAGVFSPMGPHLDKHLRSHNIYAVLDPQSRPAPAALSSSEFRPAHLAGSLARGAGR